MRTSISSLPLRPEDRERVFRELLREHAGRLRRIAAGYARGADREDLYQDILVQIWRSLPSFRGDAALGTWVYRVALNTALTWTRVRRRRPVEVQPAEDADRADPISTGEPTREEAVLAQFLASLGEIDRTVLVLVLDGLSHQEIADILGSSAGAVSVRLHRIKRLYEKRYLEGRS